MNPTLPALVAAAPIESQNVLAAGAIYAAFQLEQMNLFRAADRIVELFQQGMLPVGRTTAGRLTKYVDAGPNRLSEAERRALYALMFGAGGHPHAPEANRDFTDLWMRFISAVSTYQRTQRGREHLRKRGRDLAANLSLHGWGIGYFAASRLRNHTTAAMQVLALPEIRKAYGARDAWQVVERVSVNDLGGAVNVARYRTLTTAGLEIVQWLAALGRRSNTPAGVPTRALMKACEAWLDAASGDHGDS